MTDKKYWIILADTQLGAVHWQRLEREEDYYRAFQNQCQAAADDENCLGVLGLGDIRERASIQAKNLGGLNRGLKILADAGKPMLAIMGNHDYTTPNWIEEMCYPSLKNLTDKAVQKEYGFDPETTLALDYTPKGQIEEELKKANPEKLDLVFLHQSLKELTTNILQSYQVSLGGLAELGFGRKKGCLVFLGDLHNYGDAQLTTPEGHVIEAAYPGSPEMTDANEGINGLKSKKVPSAPHDYRKFVIHFFPQTRKWKPIPIKPRPWFRGKAKTEKEADRVEGLLREEASTWEMPGCVYISVPKGKTDHFRKILREIPVLEGRVEEYDPEKERDTEEEAVTVETSLSWQENKKSLIELGQTALDADAFELLKAIAAADGSTHNPKNDVLSAWKLWSGETKPDQTGSEKPQEETSEETEKPAQYQLFDK